MIDRSITISAPLPQFKGNTAMHIVLVHDDGRYEGVTLEITAKEVETLTENTTSWSRFFLPALHALAVEKSKHGEA